MEITPSDAAALYAAMRRGSDRGVECRNCHVEMERDSADLWVCDKCGRRERER